MAPNRDRSNGANLEFIAPLEKDGVKLVKFDEAKVADEVKRWKQALIVYVLGAKPPFNVMKQFFERRQGRFAEFKLFLLKTGVYVVEFRDMESRIEVMDIGPWSFDNKPIIVKPWSVEANLEKQNMVEVPVWIRFLGLKLHLWSNQLLNELASVIGKPLFTDKMTAERKIIIFARVCIKVNVVFFCHKLLC